MMTLKPLLGRALVELTTSTIAITEQKYDPHTHGVCLDFVYDATGKKAERDVIFETYQPMVGKVVFWQQFKEGEIIERDSKRYTFVKIEDIDGYEDDES